MIGLRALTKASDGKNMNEKTKQIVRRLTAEIPKLEQGKSELVAWRNVVIDLEKRLSLSASIESTETLIVAIRDAIDHISAA